MGAGSEPSGNGGFASVGITLLMVAKKLHMPAVDGLRVRAWDAAARASETSGRLLKRSVEQVSAFAAWVERLFKDLEPGMESFHDTDDRWAHDRFVKWFEENPDGFFINFRTASDMMLHRSSCPSLIFHGPVSLTRNRKLCSSDKDMLERWASRQWGATSVYCSICAP